MRLIRELQLHSVSSVFAALTPDGKPDARSKMGLSSLLEMIWGEDFVDEGDARFINDPVHANIRRNGTFSVVPQMKGGVTNSSQLRRIAEVADKYDVPLIKLTGGQRIDLLGIRKEDLPGVWADLDMPSGYAYGKSFRTVKTCVGSDFCRFGVGDSTALSIAIEERYQGLASPAKMKLARHRVSAQLRRGAVQGPWRRRRRRRPVGDVRRSSTTARTRTGWSAPMPGCRGWESTRSAPWWSTTPRASPPNSTRR
jgi:nitrite reductase (NADH) large subunit